MFDRLFITFAIQSYIHLLAIPIFLFHRMFCRFLRPGFYRLRDLLLVPLYHCIRLRIVQIHHLSGFSGIIDKCPLLIAVGIDLVQVSG